MKNREIKVFNACKDITEVDIVRQRYYQLMREQALRNATKTEPKKSLFGLFKNN